MCLNVVTKKKVLVQKVIKLLEIDGDRAYTPYRGIRIDANGLLVAFRPKADFEKEVNGQGVHSILSKDSYWCGSNRSCSLIPAYAICVFAQGDRQDIVSRAK